MMQQFTRQVSNDLYSRTAIAAARAAYAPYCSVRILPKADNSAEVTVTISDAHTGDARKIALEFWNFVIDTECQRKSNECG
jgi:hypothetical protein